MDYPKEGAVTLGEDKHVSREFIEVPDDLSNIAKTVDLEAFMAEKVVIRLEKVKGALPNEIVSLNVNGTWQHLFRGLPQTVSRKYIEVLARSHQTEYAYESEGAIMDGDMPQPMSTQSHPFQILKDTEKGLAWYEELIRQPR